MNPSTMRCTRTAGGRAHRSPWLFMPLVLLLAACGSGSGGDGGQPALPASALCVSDACGEAVELFAIPEAENTAVSPDGRLFVAADNLYEVVAGADGTLERVTRAQGQGSFFNGMVVDRGMLYAIRGDELTAARLDDPDFALQVIAPLNGFVIPNGMTVDAQHRLYISDGPVPLSPKIERFILAEDDPLTVTGRETWLTDGLLAPNGLDVAMVDGRELLFFTDDGTLSVNQVEITPDGSPGEVQRLLTRATFFDDLKYYDGHLLVTDFLRGTVLLMDLAGEVLQETAPMSFIGPTSVQVSDGRLLPAGELFVSSRGVQFETLTGLGDALSVFRPTNN